MQTPSEKTPRRVRGRPLGKRVRSKRRRPENARTASDNPFAHTGKRVRRVLDADAKPKAAVRRDRKPPSTPVEIKPRVREPLTAEQLAKRREKRRERHRTRKLGALQELLAEMNLEVVPKKEAS